MKLQEIRNKKGISQSQLANLSGIPLRTIQQWECGQRDIDGAALNRMCDLAAALDCKIYDIIESAELIDKLKTVL